MRFHSGLTLVELVIAIALASLFVMLAAPSLKGLQARRATDAALTLFTDDLGLARSEAIKRGHSVTICSSVNGNNCAGIEDWRSGWIVYFNAPVPGGGTSSMPAVTASEVLRVQGPVPGVRSIVATDASLTFRPNGLGYLALGNVRVSSQADATHDRLLCISSSGRASVRPVGTASC